ncbi:hypothetical protein EV401DRAFT_1895686 [Pisolithus croceorrhizus]|nr:hypothetical protein EV401DRAFT_1895686 [Pisolithus croceorrhizus]
MLIPTEEMQSIAQPCCILVNSWVYNLTGPFKNDIGYVLSTDGDFVKMLLVPWEVSYHSTPQNQFHGHTLFDVDLARAHGLEVTVSTDEDGHPITTCVGNEYHCGCTCLFFHKNQIKVMETLAGFTLVNMQASWLMLSQWTANVIVGMNCGFEGMVIGKVDDMFVVQGNVQKASHNLVNSGHWNIPSIACLPNNLLYDPLANENHMQPGDSVQAISRPHKGLSGMLHYYGSQEILITPSTLPQKGTDNPRDKGKSKAQESEPSSGDSDINEDSDLVQVSVSMDDAIILPPSTLQFSKERGYDVSISDHVQVTWGPACCLRMVHGFCLRLEEYSLHDVEHQVGCKVWIISGPSKGYRGMLSAVVTESGMLLNGIPLDSTQMTGFIELCHASVVWTAPLPHHATLPPSRIDMAEALIHSSPNVKFLVTLSEIIGIIVLPAVKLDAVGFKLANNNTFY